MPAMPNLPEVGERTFQDSAGIALHGFDPVAYFAEARAIGGKARYEWVHAGVTWRFAKAANRDAFRQNPHAYMPAFGGYDAVAVARGQAVETAPDQFVIEDGRLILFRDKAAREKFAASPQILEQADELWPTVERQLAR
jgi:YHS domain-containing protein